MLGGGEENFAPPEEIDVETLTKFAKLCGELRALKKAGGATIARLAVQCDEVGTTMTAKEAVAGLIFRFIMNKKGADQLKYWYLLDKLAKDYPQTFGYLFSLHIFEVATDCMPWEDPALFPKLESLVEHWDDVFPADVITRIYLSRTERQWAAKNPLEAARIREEEEAKWAEVEKQSIEEDGLDLYEQPCLAFLQGRCPWGAQCTQLHPAGLEGTLPSEARLGDWRCPGCGAVNRHFRRRCFSCPREKPQFRKGCSVKTKEEELLSHPDEEARAALRQRWGYDPENAADAVKHWAARFAREPPSAFVEARRNAYVSRILPAVKKAMQASSAAAVGTRRGRDGDDQQRGGGRDALPSSSGPAKASRAEGGSGVAANASAPPAGGGPAVRVQLPQVPPELSAAQRVAYLCTKVIERGAHDADFAGFLFLLCKAMSEAVRDAKWSAKAAPEDSFVLVECAKRVFAAWTTWKAASGSAPQRLHPATPFFADMSKYLAALPLLPAARDEIRKMCDVVKAG